MKKQKTKRKKKENKTCLNNLDACMNGNSL